MISRFRCRCGYVLQLPKDRWEAASQSCPGCGSTLDYLYSDKENEARIMNELHTARRRTYIPAFLWPVCWIALWIAFFVAQPKVGEAIGWSGRPTVLTYILIVLHLLSFPLLNWLVGMGFVNSLYMKYTKRYYVEDRVAFARAGAIDLVLWVPVACVFLVFAYYWSTWRGFVSIPIWRNPLIFLVLWVTTFAMAEQVLCWFFFKVRRPAFRKRSL